MDSEGDVMSDQPAARPGLVMPWLTATGSAAVYRDGVRVDEPEPHELAADESKED
jgi:hypothetical protein